MWDLSSSTRDQACVPCIGGEFLTTGSPVGLLNQGSPHFVALSHPSLWQFTVATQGTNTEWVEKFHSSILLPPSLMMVLGTGQTPPCPEAREQRNSWAVTSRSASGHRAGWGVEGGWLQVENKPNQLCFWLPSSSRSESGVAGGPSQRHWRNCCLNPSFLPFEFGSFMSTKDSEHSWLFKTVSQIRSWLSHENEVITRRGVVCAC